MDQDTETKIQRLSDTMVDWIEMAMLDASTRTNCCGKVDKAPLLTNITNAVEDGLEATMAALPLEKGLKAVLESHILKSLVAVAVLNLNNDSFTRNELDAALDNIRQDVSRISAIQLKPYVALLGLCSFPERF